jgi:hypothetical protein
LKKHFVRNVNPVFSIETTAMSSNSAFSRNATAWNTNLEYGPHLASFTQCAAVLRPSGPIVTVVPQCVRKLWVKYLYKDIHCPSSYSSREMSTRIFQIRSAWFCI